MRRETFNSCFTALVNGYAYAAEKIPAATQDVYWEMLQGIPDDAFDRGVRKCLATCKYFPTIAELGEASLPARIDLQPYNPRVYHEPVKVTWERQVAELERQRQLNGVAGKMIEP